MGLIDGESFSLPMAVEVEVIQETEETFWTIQNVVVATTGTIVVGVLSSFFWGRRPVSG